MRIPKKIMAKMYYCSIKLQEVLVAETFATFLHAQSWVVQDAVIRKLTEISFISELILDKHRAFCSCHPEIPFTELSGMKRYLTKVQDGNIDLALIWNTVEKVIPELSHKIEAVFRNLR